MHTLFAPHTIISPALIEALREEAPAAEGAGVLTDAQLRILFREGWFRMFLPRSMGGMSLSLPDALRLEEAIAWIDGSLGWTVTLCSGATLFAGYMKPEVSAGLLADPAACFGGSGQATGTAVMMKDGYRVSGRWRYATGAPHLSVFTANCLIEQDGRMVTQEDGRPLMRSFFFMRHEVSLTADWHTMGLKATAGHTFEVKELAVPADRVFDIDAESAQLEQPVFRYPFLPFAEATLAVNTLGMTLRFLELCEQLFAKRGSDKRYDEEVMLMLNGALIRAKGEVSRLRHHFYGAVAQSWASLEEEGMIRPGLLHDVSAASRILVRECRSQLVELFPYCGMTAADPRTELNRIWRDLFTASQHTLLTYPAH